MANDMNRWNNAAGFNMHELFNDEGISSIDNKNGYLNIELSGRHQLQAALDSLGVSMFGNSDLFLHGFRSTDFVTNTKEETNDAAAMYFENGLRFGETSMSGNILATASLQKEDDLYSNKIDNYYGMGASVVIINIPHHYKDIHMGPALRESFMGDSYEEKTARMEHQHCIALDGMGLDAIPKEFIVGVYYRDYTKPEAPGSGRLILNPNYIGFESNMQETSDGPKSNYEVLKDTILNAPRYDNSIIYEAEPSMDPLLINSEADRIGMAFAGMAELEMKEMEELKNLLNDISDDNTESMTMDTEE